MTLRALSALVSTDIPCLSMCSIDCREGSVNHALGFRASSNHTLYETWWTQAIKALPNLSDHFFSPPSRNSLTKIFILSSRIKCQRMSPSLVEILLMTTYVLLRFAMLCTFLSLLGMFWSWSRYGLLCAIFVLLTPLFRCQFTQGMG